MKRIIKLTESELINVIKKVISEQASTPKNKGVSTTKPKNTFIPVKVNFNTKSANGQPVVAEVTGGVSKDPTGKLTPSQTIRLKMPSNKGIQPIDFRLNGTVYTFDPYGLYKNANDLTNFMDNIANRIDKGLKPQTALQQVVAQVAKTAGQNLTLDPKVVQAFVDGFNYQSSVVTKRSKINLSGLLKPMVSASLYVTYDPESGKEIHREMWLGGSNMYTYQKDKSGKIVSTSSSNVLNDKPEFSNVDRKDFVNQISNIYNQLEKMPLEG
jgi:hypothetical protein